MLNDFAQGVAPLVGLLENHPLATVLACLGCFFIWYYWPWLTKREDRAQDRDDRGYTDQKNRADAADAKYEALQETYRKDILPLTEKIASAHMMGAEAQRQVAGVLAIANNSNNTKLDSIANILSQVSSNLERLNERVQEGNERLQSLSDNMTRQLQGKARKK